MISAVGAGGPVIGQWGLLSCHHVMELGSEKCGMGYDDLVTEAARAGWNQLEVGQDGNRKAHPDPGTRWSLCVPGVIALW